jgi:hypothetical protein
MPSFTPPPPLLCCSAADAAAAVIVAADAAVVAAVCRVCMVEADGRLKPACCTPAWEGAVINTDTDEVSMCVCGGGSYWGVCVSRDLCVLAESC